MSDDSSREPKPSDSPAPSTPPSQPEQPHAPGDVTNPPQNQQQQNQFQQQQQQYYPTHESFRTIQRHLPNVASTNDLFADYRPSLNVHDEVMDDSLALRPHWRPLAEELRQLDIEGMDRRSKQIQRTIHQNGIAYSAYGDPSVRDQHLQLDPLPLIIADQEWSQIETALKQRAELLNQLLADLNGPQNLLRDGILPVDVLWQHPHYQLPNHGLPCPGGRHLHVYSAELVRSPQGNWWVQSDRTDSPSGSGFALENRIAISRAFPDAFRRCNVKRLASYFISLKEQLTDIAKTNTDNPHIAILSAGAGSSRFFEDSFLARYLGFTLVETNDLVVRSGRVMLKTLSGLSPIDVIFRRHQSNTLDPLELGGGIPGVPGILQVIRDENVVVVNAPGSGLVESPIFMAFMPRICRALMDSDLKLPGVATWWGGEKKSLELMLDRIDQIHLLPAYRTRKLPGESRKRANSRMAKPTQTERLSRQERIELIRANPSAWVGQEMIACSSTPVFQDGRLSAGYLTIRTFLTAKKRSWHALPGGLVRISHSPFDVSRQPFQGGGTKDAWVLSDVPVEPTSLLRKPNDQLKPVRSRGFVPSRIADNLCWLGRYLERADASARLLRAIAVRLTGESDPEDSVELPMLLRALTASGQLDKKLIRQDLKNHLPTIQALLVKQAINHNVSHSLRFQIDQVVALAGTVRDRLSSDAWRIVSEMSGSFGNYQASQCDLIDLLNIIDKLVVGLAAFSGFVSESMTRTNAFNFLNIGRHLEHSLQLTALIKNCIVVDRNVTGELLQSILEVADSELTYRSRYYANLQLPAVMDLLIADELNPRSLAYQLKKLYANLEQLPESVGEEQSLDRKLTDTMLTNVMSADMFDICKVDASGHSQELNQLIASIEQTLPQISTSISNRFFVHSGTIHQLVVEPLDDQED
ncbi:MAG: circularly permuted type 2 ATP-grasp protein [Planctomycetota bacterium]